MSFKFIGEGGGAVPAESANSSIWVYKSANFTYWEPRASDVLQLWDPTNPRMPEPDSAHVLVYTQTAWMKQVGSGQAEDYPPSCGAAFGYKKYLKGSVPQKVYGWRGSHMPYPFTYSDKSRYGGFNTSASLAGAMLIPNPTDNSHFNNSDLIAPDAEANKIGAWDVVYNGGNGHWFDRGTGLTHKDRDAPGSNGSIFGRGVDGAGEYPSGTGGPGTTTARGPVAERMSSEVFEELGALRHFIKGKAYDGTDPDYYADNGDFVINPDAGMLMLGGVPVGWDASKLKLGTGIMNPGQRTVAPSYAMSFNVILEYRR